MKNILLRYCISVSLLLCAMLQESCKPEPVAPPDVPPPVVDCTPAGKPTIYAKERIGTKQWYPIVDTAVTWNALKFTHTIALDSVYWVIHTTLGDTIIQGDSVIWNVLYIGNVSVKMYGKYKLPSSCVAKWDSAFYSFSLVDIFDAKIWGKYRGAHIGVSETRDIFLEKVSDKYPGQLRIMRGLIDGCLYSSSIDHVGYRDFYFSDGGTPLEPCRFTKGWGHLTSDNKLSLEYTAYCDSAWLSQLPSPPKCTHKFEATKLY